MVRPRPGTIAAAGLVLIEGRAGLPELKKAPQGGRRRASPDRNGKQ
jgi:hypothetical protein